MTTKAMQDRLQVPARTSKVLGYWQVEIITMGRYQTRSRSLSPLHVGVTCLRAAV
jgi:hypothetical protein